MIDYGALHAVVPGNIDLTHRPHVENADGSVSTLETMSFQDDDGLEIVIPKVADQGFVLSDDDAIRVYRQTGRHLGKYRTVEDAEAAAQEISADQSANVPVDTLAVDKALALYFGSRRLYGRSCSVQVDDLLLDARHVDRLAVSFDIQKSLSPKTPNHAEVRVWNLSSDHRRQLQQLERVYVSLEAGYLGARSLVFRGDLRGVSSQRDGSKWVTTITSDSGRTARKQRLAKSFAPGASVGEVLRAAASAMNVRIGNTQLAAASARISQTRAGQFFNGYALAGAVSDELDRLARSAGLEWSIQDDELQFLERGRALQEEAVYLSSNTGLVGAAERGNAGITQVRALMLPDLYPGRRVVLESATLSGVYRVETTKHRGGLAEREFYIDMELKPEGRK